MEGSSIGVGLARGHFRKSAAARKKKVAVIPARVMKEYRGMEMRLHSFLISTPDGEIERSTRDLGGGDPPL